MRRYRVDLAVQKAFLEDAKGDARVPILKEIKGLEVSIRVTEEQLIPLASKAAKLSEEIKHLSTESVDIEMLQAQLKTLDQILYQFVGEMERMRVEIRTAPRVRLLEHAE